MPPQQKTRTGLIIRHVPHEGIAGYREPIEAAGYALARIDVSDTNFGAIDLGEPDLLIMMGGPMGVYEQDAHPWIVCQQRRLARRLDAGRPTLGVCFGAQMMAAAMGAENSVFLRDGEVSIGLTYMTGTLVKFGQRLASAFMGGPRFAWAPYLMLWLGLIVGSVSGALTYAHFALSSIWFAAIAAAGLALLMRNWPPHKTV